MVKRERIYPVYHSDPGLVYLHPFHQCADDFSASEPVGVVQSRLDALGEFLQVADHQLQLAALRLVGRLLLGFVFQLAQTVSRAAQSRLEFALLQEPFLVGIDQPRDATFDLLTELLQTLK